MNAGTRGNKVIVTELVNSGMNRIIMLEYRRIQETEQISKSIK